MKILVLLALTASTLFAQSVADPLDSLSAEDVQKALTLLKSNYARPDALSDSEMARATMRGLMTRLGPGVSVVSGSAANTTPGPFRSEILNGTVGYLRLGELSEKNVGELDGALKTLHEKEVQSAVLDLRATPATGNFEAAAEVAKRFCAKGKLLFTLKKSPSKPERVFTSNIDPLFQGLLVVLADADTAGAAEAIPAVLRAQAQALVVGEKTSGRAFEFAELPLHGGAILRVAVAEILLPDNSPISQGVKPDIAVMMPASTLDEVLKTEMEKGVTPLIAENARVRMNEASLVAGINPEIDAVEAAQRNSGKLKVPVLHDTQLQRALDLITTVRVYDKARTEK